MPRPHRTPDGKAATPQSPPNTFDKLDPEGLPTAAPAVVETESVKPGTSPGPSQEGVHGAAPASVPPGVIPEEEERGSPPVCGAVSPGETSQTGCDAAAARADVVIPPPPPKGLEGDKTPEFMRWLAKYHPDEFRVQYANRGGTLVRELLESLTVTIK